MEAELVSAIPEQNAGSSARVKVNSQVGTKGQNNRQDSTLACSVFDETSDCSYHANRHEEEQG